MALGRLPLGWKHWLVLKRWLVLKHAAGFFGVGPSEFLRGNQTHDLMPEGDSSFTLFIFFLDPGMMLRLVSKSRMRSIEVLQEQHGALCPSFCQ